MFVCVCVRARVVCVRACGVFACVRQGLSGNMSKREKIIDF